MALHYTVYQAPEEELDILDTLMQIRCENWSVIFNEEDDGEDDLDKNDIEAMVYESWTP